MDSKERSPRFSNRYSDWRSPPQDSCSRPNSAKSAPYTYLQETSNDRDTQKTPRRIRLLGDPSPGMSPTQLDVGFPHAVASDTSGASNL
jgi:hypothetical protein